MELTNDIKLQLINGVPIFVKGIGNVYPLKMKEIALCIESKYNAVISLFTRTLDDLDIDNIDDKELTYYDFFIFTCLKDEQIRRYVEEIMGMILRNTVTMEKENLCFFIGDKSKPVLSKDVKLIDKDTFYDLADVLRFQNCIEKTKPKPKKKKVDPRIEALKKKQSQGRQILKEAKGEDFSMSDIQSTLSVLYQDVEKVSNMTVFQVNDQYAKLMRKEQYDRQYSAYIAGADPKKLELSTHWSSKQIKKNMDNTPPPN